MRKFGLSLVGLSLVSSVSSFAAGENTVLNEQDKIVAGESAVLNEQDKAILDKSLRGIKSFIDAIALLFEENSDYSVNEIKVRFFDQLVELERLFEEFTSYKPSNEGAFEDYLSTLHREMMRYSEERFPAWLFDGKDFLLNNESRVPEIHKENYRFLCKVFKTV